MGYPPESTLRLLLKIAKDKKVHSVLDTEKILASKFKLSKSEKTRIKKSGRERLFLYTVRWSGSILKYSGLVTDPKTGYFKITPPILNDKFLSQFPEFTKWRRRKNNG